MKPQLTPEITIKELYFQRIIDDAYRDWTLGAPRNTVVLPYVSMHESTKRMVEHFVGALVEKCV